MHINPTVHCTPETRAFGEILTLSTGERFMTFRIAEERYGGSGVDLIIRTPELLDMISNEAERLCREFVGDVPALAMGGTATVTVGPGVIPPLEPLHMTGQFCECCERKGLVDEEVLRAQFSAYESEHGR